MHWQCHCFLTFCVTWWWFKYHRHSGYLYFDQWPRDTLLIHPHPLLSLLRYHASHPFVLQPLTRKRKTKIGVSIVISLPENRRQISEQFKTFFFSHFSMFERHFHRLCTQIETILLYQRKALLKSSMEVTHVMLLYSFLPSSPPYYSSLANGVTYHEMYVLMMCTYIFDGTTIYWLIDSLE